MTDSPPKRRPWFQLHLSTCVVLMVVAGLGIWKNTKPRRVVLLFSVVDPYVVRDAEVYRLRLLDYPAIEPCIVQDNDGRKIPFSTISKLRPWSIDMMATFGWPFEYGDDWKEVTFNNKAELLEAFEQLPGLFINIYNLDSFGLNEWLFLNIAIWFAILLAAAASIEMLIRRRERKRAATEPAP